MKWNEFVDYMEHHDHAMGVIVFTKDSFDKPYPVVSRSYRVFSTEKYFHPEMGGTSLFGSCLDDKDDGVNLDYYMKVKNWKPEYCYLEFIGRD